MTEGPSPFGEGHRQGWEGRVDEGVGERGRRGGKAVERCSTAWFQPLRTPEPLAPAAH